jgi:signal transduction histidine kinase
MHFGAIPARLMRRPGLLVLLLGGALAVLGVLQYRWLTELSAVEHRRRQAGLARAATLFQEDFDRKLTLVFGTFQSAVSGEGGSLESRVLEQHDQWMNESPFAPLVRDMYWVQADSAEQPRRLSVEERTFVPSGLPSGIRLVDLQSEWGFGPGRGRQGSASLFSDPPVVVFPRFLDARPEEPVPSSGWLIVEFDGSYLRETMLPSLLGRYRLDEDYDVLIRGPFGPDSTLYRSRGDLGPDDFTDPNVVLALGRIRLEDFAPGMPPLADGASRIAAGDTTRLFAPGRRRVRYAAAGRLLLQHRSGSMEAAVASNRARNLAVSFGILLLLGGSMTLIFVSARRAQRLSRQQVQFVAGVSHELYTPLAVIRAAAENLSDGVVADPERARRYGEVIGEEGRRLSEMVDQILQFSSLERPERSLQRRPVAIQEVVQRAVETQRNVFKKSDFTVDVSIPSGLPPIDVDAAAITSALSNLIGNAVKHAGSSKRIEIEAKEREGRRGREVEITVSDEGPGIDPDDRDMIFEPFYRGRGAVASQIRGSGLGLNLVKQIVEAHGGRIELRPGSGKGACFAVCLPVSGDDGASSRDDAPGTRDDATASHDGAPNSGDDEPTSRNGAPISSDDGDDETIG